MIYHSLGVSLNLRKAIRKFEIAHILAVALHKGGNVDLTAEALGIARTNMYRKCRHLGITIDKSSHRIVESRPEQVAGVSADVLTSLPVRPSDDHHRDERRRSRNEPNP